MLYTRSSFLKYLTEKRECEVTPLNKGRNAVLQIKNGPASAHLHLNSKDRIAYEEIYILCKKIYVDLPGDKDLTRIE